MISKYTNYFSKNFSYFLLTDFALENKTLRTGYSFRNSDNSIHSNNNQDSNSPWDLPRNCGLSKVPKPSWSLKIIGGKESTKGNWPWQVAILNKYKVNLIFV